MKSLAGVRATIGSLKRSLRPTGHQMIWWLRLATSWLRRKPDFIIIGAMKCGTTSLLGYLDQHPEIAASSKKEVHFFDRNHHRSKFWYRAHFPLMRPGRKRNLTGESSPSYLFNPEVPKRIFDFDPDIKLIVILREPAERSLSHYEHERRRKREHLDFRAALEQEDKRLAKSRNGKNFTSTEFLHFSYRARSLYDEQMKRYLEVFPSSNFLVVDFDELKSRPAALLTKVFRFLGVNVNVPPIDFTPMNQGSYRLSTYEQDLRPLRLSFADSNQRLFDLLGQRFDWTR